MKLDAIRLGLSFLAFCALMYFALLVRGWTKGG